jgi:hypothetical protein
MVKKFDKFSGLNTLNIIEKNLENKNDDRKEMDDKFNELKELI